MIKAAKNARRNIGNPTFDRAQKYAESRGFSVVFFDESSEELYALGIADAASGKEAYTYSDAIKAIFIEKRLEEDVKLRRLLHELGHIELGHLFSDVDSAYEKEFEAELFARFIYECLS